MSNDAQKPAGEDTFARRRALLDEWVSLEQEIAGLQARQAVLLAERLEMTATDPDADLNAGEVSLRSLAAEYAAAAHIPPSTASIRLTDAWVLVRQFPATLDALAAGAISRRHVDVILTEAPIVSDHEDATEVRAAYEAQVVPFASQDTAARTRAHARAVSGRLCPETLTEAHQRARAERSVSVRPDGDGMAVLIAILPEILAYAIHDRLTGQAKTVRAARSTGKRACRRPLPEYEPEFPEDRTSLDEHLQKIVDDVPSWEHARRPDTSSGTPAESPVGAAHIDTDTDTDADADEVIITEADLPLWERVPDGPEPVMPAVFVGHPGRSGPPGIPDFEDDWFDEQLAALEAAFYDSPLTEDPGPPAHRSGHDVIEDGVRSGEETVDEDPSTAFMDDTRSMDQLRADILTDLLLAADATTLAQTGLESIHATVQVAVPASTLIGADERFADHDGHGPLLPDTARMLAGLAPSWTRLFIDPTGLVTETDTYTPTAAMKRYLRARDQHCRFPGCRAPVHRCQIDHNIDHAKGGPTALGNLANFCTGHHPLKHPDLADEDRWTARQLPGGTIEWTSPLGRTYTDHPTRRVLFT